MTTSSPLRRSTRLSSRPVQPSTSRIIESSESETEHDFSDKILFNTAKRKRSLIENSAPSGPRNKGKGRLVPVAPNDSSDEDSSYSLPTSPPSTSKQALNKISSARNTRRRSSAPRRIPASNSDSGASVPSSLPSTWSEPEGEASDAAQSSSSASDTRPLSPVQKPARARHNRRAKRATPPPKLSRAERAHQKLLENHPEVATLWDGYAEMAKCEPTLIPQPEGVRLKLLPFQLEGVSWMLQQEKSIFLGGILADEMGMGKTIQMISTIVLAGGKPNLVLAPTVALLQWRAEIQRFTGLNVLLYHGQGRSDDIDELSAYDVILTSYSVIETSFRRQNYGFMRGGSKQYEPSALHRIHWHRVILDEAHAIKDRSCNTARATFALKSAHKWAMSGTPLQNRVGELFSLLRFLHIDPISYYMCRDCPCKSLTWSFADYSSCDFCGHKPMSHLCLWNYEVLRPIQRHGPNNEHGQLAMRKLGTLLDRIMLRRTKLSVPMTLVFRRELFTFARTFSTKKRRISTSRYIPTHNAGSILMFRKGMSVVVKCVVERLLIM